MNVQYLFVSKVISIIITEWIVPGRLTIEPLFLSSPILPFFCLQVHVEWLTELHGIRLTITVWHFQLTCAIPKSNIRLGSSPIIQAQVVNFGYSNIHKVWSWYWFVQLTDKQIIKFYTFSQHAQSMKIDHQKAINIITIVRDCLN